MSSEEFKQLYLNEHFNIKQEIHEILSNIDYVSGEYGVVPGVKHEKLYITIQKDKDYIEALHELATVLPKTKEYLQIRIQTKERKFKYCTAKQCCK